MGGKREGSCSKCLEKMDLTDQELQPCVCGYEICLWCWHFIIQTAIVDGSDARCPECCSPYDKENILKRTISKERLTVVNANKKLTLQKTKQKVSDVRKDFYNVRVLRRNIVYIANIPKELSDEKTLMKKEYFGQYGKVLKIFFSQTDGSRQHYSSDSCIVYVTFSKEEEALRCIQVVNGYLLNGRPLKASFGTTRYCYAWLKNLPCKNPDCLYIHDTVPEDDICNREEVISFCTSKLQQCSGFAYANFKEYSGSFLPPPLDAKNSPPPLGLNTNSKYVQCDSFGRSYASVAASDNQSKLPSVMPSNREEVCLTTNAMGHENGSNKVSTGKNEMSLPKHDIENFALAKPFAGSDHSHISCFLDYNNAANSNFAAEGSMPRVSLPSGRMPERIIREPFFSDLHICSQLLTSPANLRTCASAYCLSSDTDKWRCQTEDSNANEVSSGWDDLVSLPWKHTPLSLQAYPGHSTFMQQSVLPSYDWPRSGSELGSEKFSCSLEGEKLSSPSIKSSGFSTMTTNLYHEQHKPSTFFSTGFRVFHGEQKNLCSRSSSSNYSDYDSVTDKTREDELLNATYINQCEDDILSHILALELDAIDDPVNTQPVKDVGCSHDFPKTSNSLISSAGDNSRAYLSMMDGLNAANGQLSPWSSTSFGMNKNPSGPNIIARTKAYLRDNSINEFYLGTSKNSKVQEEALLFANEAIFDSPSSLDMHYSGSSLSRATQRSALSTPPGFPPLKTNTGKGEQRASFRFTSDLSASSNNLVPLGAVDWAKITSVNTCKNQNFTRVISSSKKN